jgi:hypothetical protein
LITIGLDAILETDIFGHLGWISGDIRRIDDLPQAIANRKSVAFFGLGMCPKADLTDAFVSNAAQAVDYFLQLLRTGCNTGLPGPSSKEVLLQLIKDGCLTTFNFMGTENICVALKFTRNCKYA